MRMFHDLSNVKNRCAGHARLVEQGDTGVVLEHNLDVIKTADHVIDLGPGGGVNGGRIVVTGTPEDVAAEPKSATGQYLKPLLARSSRAPAAEEQPSLIAAK